MKCLAVFGTASDVGKSVVTTAICRIFSDLNLRVAPFKAQNMSNNSFVTLEEGEIARAQFVQAEAARAEPSVDMNPVLLKPSSDQIAQVVLRGKAIGNRSAADYFSNTDWLLKETTASLDRLRSQYEMIVIEGAGSCAEINLRERDFTNFQTAHAADAPVLLVADIDRGGVFAQVIGTLAVLPEEDRRRIRGIIINRFRGDATLFADGIKYIEDKTDLPVLGLVPYFRHIEIDSEDSLPREMVVDPTQTGAGVDSLIRVGVLYFPHISNFTDFASLARENIDLHYLRKPRDLRGYHAVILPGSKNTRFDLQWLRDSGWEQTLNQFVASGGHLIGICGGYQMLGESVADPHGVEGTTGDTRGLGFLEVKTTLMQKKTLTRAKGHVISNQEPVFGYEIHNGITEAADHLEPFLSLQRESTETEAYPDGAMHPSKHIWGCYLHGIFDSPSFRKFFLMQIGRELYRAPSNPSAQDPQVFREAQYNLLADHFRKHLDVAKLLEIAGIRT